MKDTLPVTNSTSFSPSNGVDEGPDRNPKKSSAVQPSRSPRRRKLGSGLIIPLVAMLAVLSICSALYVREANQLQSSMLDREARRTEIFVHFVNQDISEAGSDLQQLEDGDGLQNYLMTGQPADLARAVHRARFFSLQNPDYDQIRYLDETGQEIIRINAKGTVVPPTQLQNEADRSYFLKTNVLAPGDLFISTFDLSVENGQVERPIKPMIRIATPVFDSTGRRRGIYVINYLGANIIARLQKFTPQYQQRLRILNAQGYWIKAARADQEWGFMMHEGSTATLAISDPALWARVSREPAGQTPYGGGYFTWHRLSFSDMPLQQREAIVTEDKFLVIASEISPQEFSAYFAGLRQTFVVVALILSLLVIISWIFFNSRQYANQERDRFFDMTRDMLCIAGFDGYFKRVNPAWENTFGYNAQELLSRPFLEFVHPEDREKTRAATAQLRLGQDVISFENRYRCKDGSYRWLLWSARPLMYDQRIFASARDLTERKRIEEKNLELNEELRSRARELESANRELEAFSYSVSHDLRAPLRHVHGFVELLQKSPAIQREETSMRYMGVIAKAAGEMGVLIDDLLSFSRTGRAEMHPMKINMQALVNETIKKLESESAERRIIWDVQPMPVVFGDPSLLRLAWVNLIANAIKYTRTRDEARIEIGQDGGTAKAASPSEIVFYIRDNGVGFDMQYASKLFGVFQRLHRAEEFEGTGIGLANVQRIIQRHGGRVWAESKVDHGAVFYFSLPISTPGGNHADNQTHTPC